MAKKDSLRDVLPFGDRHPADAKLINFTYRDLKREVIIRGMPFEKVVKGSFVSLSLFYREKYFSETQPELLDQFDDWQEEEIRKHIKATGRKVESYVTDPSLRLGFIGERGDDGEVLSTKKIKGLTKVKKIKRERTNHNLYSGTKKALTFELQREGKSKEEVIAIVMGKFSDANEKSIGIWYNKSKKLSGNGITPKTKILSKEEKIQELEKDLKNSGRGQKILRKSRKS